MHPYSAKDIVASVHPGCSDLMSKQMEMDDDDYIINSNVLKIRQG